MPNTVTQRTLFGDTSSKRVVRSIHVVSDGSEETDLVVYDNSAFVADTSKGKVTWVAISGSATGPIILEWDQTADSPIVALGNGDGMHDFRPFGGITNPGAAGATGDVVMTTTNLANLDAFTVIFEVDQS